MNPFDYINSINHNKQDLMVDQETENAYNSFVVNRSLSYFWDTCLLANEINIRHHSDKKLQYHFLLNTVRERKRFSKWMKPEVESDIEIIKHYFGYSNEKARQALSLLSPSQINVIKDKVKKGGRV